MMHFKKCLGVFIFLVLLCTISNLTMAQEELKSIIILTLGEIADSSTTSLIYNQLRDKDIFVRMAALRALGKINDQSLLPKLRLIQERNKLVSIYLTALLTRLGDEEARTKIKGYLKSDNIQLKTGALSVIRIFDISNVLLEVQVGSKPIMDKIDPIINTIISYLNDKNPDIRKKAIELLLSIDKAKTEENFKIILPHLNLNDESLEVRRMALLYISYLDIEEYYGKMSRKDAIFFLKELRNRLYEEDKYIRSFAKIILAKIKDGNSIKIIKNDLLNPGTFLHASSVYALACAKDFEAIPILANDFLDNRFSIVDRQYLIYALKVIQSYSYSDIVKIPKRIRCY
ncbi:MAG: HEAT repeat domain-containing protein, partial [Candidatus Omnitrophica bacterium]|nr:HEAT repeat domain-containing protein [Candidatus Omnitrophota bacterium]